MKIKRSIRAYLSVGFVALLLTACPCNNDIGIIENNTLVQECNRNADARFCCMYLCEELTGEPDSVCGYILAQESCEYDDHCFCCNELLDSETTTTTTMGGGDFDITMIDIPGGTFWMGCSPGDSDCQNDEKPRHEVTIPAFQMSAYEITQGQWEAVMSDNPARFYECGSKCPVESVSWYDVQEFIEALNNKTGQQYRLPTEAEWEYAARGGTTTPYYCGDNEACLDDIAWYDGNYEGQTHPVGQKQPNAWGLYDMIGNVEEWCSDWYHFDYYSISPSTDPQGPETGSHRVSRGGTYERAAQFCRSSNRTFGLFDPSLRYITHGFRLCLPQ